ncbi:MAG: hypothetical protein OIF51_10905 [Cellvibrionaceae bacterium]|nr:hypothetical protein [Cellvibrionaceae bacterium]
MSQLSGTTVFFRVVIAFVLAYGLSSLWAWSLSGVVLSQAGHWVMGVTEFALFMLVLNSVLLFVLERWFRWVLIQLLLCTLALLLGEYL